MDIDKVYEFSAGKNDWNTIEVGLHDGRIVVRDQIGMLEFDEDDVDQLHEGVDQARRQLRENQRRPTASNTDNNTEADETVEAAPASDDEHSEDPEDDTDADDEIQSTGLGPQFPG
jgi:hypothetical protein